MLLIWITSVAAASPSSDTSGLADILTVYGPFAPFAAALLAAIKVLWARIRALEEKAAADQAALFDKVVPALIESTRLNAEGVRLMGVVADQAAALRAVPQLDADFWRRVQNVLERIERGPAPPIRARAPRRKPDET